MSESRYFLKEIFLTEDPILFKFVDLETGEDFKKHLTDFLGDGVFINKLADNDKKAIECFLSLI